MNWNEINDWFDSFYEEYIENKKSVRGSAFSGAKIEIWGRTDLVIVLMDPYLRGSNQDDRATDFIKNVFNVNHQKIFAEITYDRFKKIVSGEQPLVDEDWTWPDEAS